MYIRYNIVNIILQVVPTSWKKCSGNNIVLAPGRATLIAGLPPRLTSSWIVSSQISSNSPFPPSRAGRLEQLKSPWHLVSPVLPTPTNYDAKCLQIVTKMQNQCSKSYKMTKWLDIPFHPKKYFFFCWKISLRWLYAKFMFWKAFEVSINLL